MYWIDEDTEKNYIIVEKLFGKIGYADSIANDEDYIDKKLKISDFNISDNIKKIILSSDNINSEEILASLTYIRTFTSIENSGISKIGSLRNARCIKKGLIFLGDIDVDESYEELVSEVLKCIKWLGSMRTRGFGNVKISVAGGID